MLALTYVTAGPWGPGVGRLIEAAEVDENFFALAEALAVLEVNPPVPVSIAHVEVAAGQIVVHLSDGSRFGPALMPVAGMRWGDTWQPETGYEAFTLLLVPNIGLFLVLEDHVSGESFDPGLTVPAPTGAGSTEGDVPVYLQVFGLVPGGVPQVREVDATAHTLELDDAGHYLRATHPDGLLLTVPDQGAVAFPVATELAVRQSSPAPVILSPGGAAVINPVEGRDLRTGFEGAVVFLKKVAANAWDVWGDLAEAVTEPDTEPPTEEPTELPTEEPTELPTEPVTEPGTEPPTETA